MEPLGNLVNQTLEHSNNLQTTSKANTDLREITREEEVGLFSIINQARALQGWTLAPAHELAPICKVWWKEFARYRIHPKHYETLFQRAHDARINSMRAGARNIPAIDATLLPAGSLPVKVAATTRESLRIASTASEPTRSV